MSRITTSRAERPRPVRNGTERSALDPGLERASEVALGSSVLGISAGICPSDGPATTVFKRRDRTGKLVPNRQEIRRFSRWRWILVNQGANVASAKQMSHWCSRALQAALAICMLGAGDRIFAQQAGQNPPQPSPSQPATSQTPTSQSQTQTKTGSETGSQSSPTTSNSNVPKNDRIFYALPNYLTVENASSLPPLTVGQKFKLVAQGTFDPLEFAFLALEAGVNQASNTNPTFGQGFKGYGKRYALAFTDNAMENFGTGAIFPALLHQDPRYYQIGKGKFLHRAEYAGLRIFLTRSDSGKAQFNYSEIFGSALAAGISNSYHPPPQTLVENINVWWTQIGWDAVGYEMKEFWPDIHRYLKRKFNRT